MLQFVAVHRSAMMELLRKAYQWCRIALALNRLRRVNEEEREFAQAALALAMGEARGLAMKVGQFLAGFEDKASPYNDLVVSFNPLPLDSIKPELIKHLKRPLEQVFTEFEGACAAASLGQVHRAVLKDGTNVAVKIRYPGIVRAIKAELALSDRMPAGGPVRRWRIDTADYKNVLRRQLLRETDYLIEMQTQRRFKQNARVDGLRIPEIYSDLSSEAVLVQSWETGYRFSEVCHWPKKDRLEIGRTLLTTLFQGLFVNGEVHGDPHPGNYLFRYDADNRPQTIMLDFGCTILVKKESRLALLKLIDFYQAGQSGDCDPLACFVAMGFDAEKLNHVEAEMSRVSAVLLKPFVAERPFHMGEWHVGAELQALLDERRWWFRSAGPAELFLLLRAFHGLVQQLERLDVALPWWPLLRHVVGDQLLLCARNLELPKRERVSKSVQKHKDRARKLCVTMTENDVIRVCAELPAEAVFDLESIIPGQVLLMLIASSEVDFAELGSRLNKEGLLPQVLFDFSNGTKHCRIWLD